MQIWLRYFSLTYFCGACVFTNWQFRSTLHSFNTTTPLTSIFIVQLQMYFAVVAIVLQLYFAIVQLQLYNCNCLFVYAFLHLPGFLLTDYPVWRLICLAYAAELSCDVGSTRLHCWLNCLLLYVKQRVCEYENCWYPTGASVVIWLLKEKETVRGKARR